MSYSDVNIFVTCQWFLFIGWFILKYQTQNSRQRRPLLFTCVEWAQVDICDFQVSDTERKYKLLYPEYLDYSAGLRVIRINKFFKWSLSLEIF